MNAANQRIVRNAIARRTAAYRLSSPLEVIVQGSAALLVIVV